MVPTRVHERYAYPVFALAIILAAVAWRWRLAYVALTVTVFLNMYAALTNPFYDNPGISDWLGIGPTLRGEWGVAFIAVANGAIFLWALAQLRPSALARLAEELARGTGARRTPRSGEVDDRTTSRSRRRAWRGGDGMVGAWPPPVRRSRLATAIAGHAARRSRAPPSPRPRPRRRRPMASWTPRPTLDEVGVVGWLKARFNERRSARTAAPRSATRAAAGSTGSTCSWSCC